MDAVRNVICAVLRGEEVRWPYGADTTSFARFLAAARFHGVVPLLAAALERRSRHDWPDEIVAACREGARVQAAWDLAQRASDKRVIDALCSAGAIPLVLKGSGLAHTLYANPFLRPRGDTDLLVAPAGRAEAERVLGKLGYAKSGAMDGEFISYQATWSHSAAFGTSHHVDLHWRVNNSQMLARAADYDELASRAVPVAALGSGALTLCLVDALLFACVHRIGHVYAPYFVDGIAHDAVDRLIWLYDIHLLMSALSNVERDEFARLAASKQIRAICRDALVAAHERLDTPVEPGILEALDNAGGTPERSACYLKGGRLRLMLEDFRALDHWSARADWARELAFPPARYMHAKYPDASVSWLPVLYLRRSLTGISRLISPRRAGDAP